MTYGTAGAILLPASTEGDTGKGGSKAPVMPRAQVMDIELLSLDVSQLIFLTSKTALLSSAISVAKLVTDIAATIAAFVGALLIKLPKIRGIFMCMERGGNPLKANVSAHRRSFVGPSRSECDQLVANLAQRIDADEAALALDDVKSEIKRARKLFVAGIDRDALKVDVQILLVERFRGHSKVISLLAPHECDSLQA
jgi:hypothetical protein